MRAIMIGDDFTAKSEKQMRELASVYENYLLMLEIADGDEQCTAMVQQAANRAFGPNFETARKCHELYFG